MKMRLYCTNHSTIRAYISGWCAYQLYLVKCYISPKWLLCSTFLIHPLHSLGMPFSGCTLAGSDLSNVMTCQRGRLSGLDIMGTNNVRITLYLGLRDVIGQVLNNKLTKNDFKSSIVGKWWQDFDIIWYVNKIRYSFIKEKIAVTNSNLTIYYIALLRHNGKNLINVSRFPQIWALFELRSGRVRFTGCRKLSHENSA